MQKRRLGFQVGVLISALVSAVLGSVVLVGQGIVDSDKTYRASLPYQLVGVESCRFEPMPLPWPRPIPIPTPLPIPEPTPSPEPWLQAYSVLQESGPS
jgi:hypothetical protein